MSVQISVKDEVKKVLDQLAKERDCTVGEAAEYIIGIGISRLSATRRYYKGKRGEDVKPKRGAKKEKAEKAAAKKPEKKAKK